jgi:putative ABC transport system ATP-binding protein
LSEAREPGSQRLRIEELRSTLAGPFDLTMARGECVAVTGPSGSGKSLFLRMVADLDPNQGRVWLDGRERLSFAPPAWRRQVVHCPADSGWWDERVAPHFPGASLPAAEALGSRFGLTDGLMQGPVLRLSTGERQRLALIRALVLEPPVLLLDEPTGPLDSDSTALVETELRARLDAGMSILLVTHNPEQAARLAGRQLHMADRHLVTT